MKIATGSIDTTAKGRFRVRVPAWGERKTIGTYDTIEEAERARAASLEALNESEFLDREGGVTLAEYGAKVLNERETRNVVRDPLSDRGRWEQHILTDRLAKMPLRRIRTHHVDAFLDRFFTEKKLGHQTLLNTLNVLRVIFNHAKRKRIVRDTPCAGLIIPTRPKRTSEPWTYLVPEEQAALLAVTLEPDRHVVGFAIGTGLRAGELVTLRIADVRLDGTEPHVVVRYGKPPNKPTKTGKIRTVPLFGLSLKSALAWSAQLAAFAPENPEGLFFPSADGGFRSAGHVLPWEVWKGRKDRPGKETGIVTRAGITRNVRWHDLRHTCGSSLISGWWGRRWSLEEVKELLGHADISITQRYAHLGDTALKAAARGTNGAPDAAPEAPKKQSDTDGPRPPEASKSPVKVPLSLLVHGFENRGNHQVSDRFQNVESTHTYPTSTGAGPWPVVAHCLLEAVAAGENERVNELSRELALAVLAAAPLAAEVLAGSEHSIARAVDLAALLIKATGAASAARARGAR